MLDNKWGHCFGEFEAQQKKAIKKINIYIAYGKRKFPVRVLGFHSRAAQCIFSTAAPCFFVTAIANRDFNPVD